MKRWIYGCALLLSGWLLVACQSPPPPPGDAMQLTWGGTIYRLQCARCHEPGRVAPVLTEERLLRYGDAEQLYAYIHENMPLDKPSALPDQDYWDVTAYVLANADLLFVPRQKALGPDIAAQVDFIPK